MELLARAGLTAACVVFTGSLLMLPATDSGTPARAVTLLTLGGGLAAIATTAVLIRIGRRRRDS